MSAIAGVAVPGAEKIVSQMLERMAHRGSENAVVKVVDGVTLGISWPAGQPNAERVLAAEGAVEDFVNDSHYARAQATNGTIEMTRDPLGISPLYYGYHKAYGLCFASEVKGLPSEVEEVKELPPGSRLKDGKVQTEFTLQLTEPVEGHRLSIAAELRKRLEKSIEKRAKRGVAFGSWLSGGLDSSIMAAMSRPYIDTLHTFAAGFPGAPDLEFAQIVARHIGSKHHEVIPTFKEIINLIPDVIYHLESFDALLIRSTLMNYLVAKYASDYVPAVFSGEGGDELFAGYEYLKDLSLDDLPGELIDITGRLHNTALQRVDRCSAAHGTVAYLGFLDQDVVDYAHRIPAEYKIYNGMEKWILRRAVFDLLPESISLRKKAKFWEGAGVEDQIANYVADKVTDDDFRNQRRLPNGEELNTKEELYYYRIFVERFGVMKNLEWMGRTKGSPKAELN